MLDVPEDADVIIQEFSKRFVDTEIFFDPFAKDKFARYLKRTHEEVITDYNKDVAHRAIEETQLFIEAAYRCYDRISEAADTTA